MAGTTMWLNEINYFSGPSNVDFVEVAVPVDNNYRPPFTIVIYDKNGNLVSTHSSAAATGVNNGLNFIKFDAIGNLPDDGIAVALLREDGFVRQFISFGTGTSVTAANGPLAGTTSSLVNLTDTHLTRTIGLTGTASGPEGWTWTANVANINGGRANVGQVHSPTVAVALTPISGNAGANVMMGSTKQDYLLGEGGNDTLYGLNGADILDGGDGDDILVGGSGGAGGVGDTLIGGAGTDQASYQASISSVTLNLATGIHTGDSSGDTFDSIENFRLTNFDDTFTMSDDGIVGSVNLDDGADIFNGAAAADRAFGGRGDDTLNGGGGADRLDGQADNDTINGGDGNDTLRGSTGDDTLNGDAGDDLVYGGDGNDTIDGGTEDDRLIGDGGHDDIYGGAGNDSLNGGDGNDNLFGGDGNDQLRGGSGTNLFVGGAGEDLMFATVGAVDTFEFSDNTFEGLDRIYGFTIGEDSLDIGTAEIALIRQTDTYLSLTLDTGTEIRLVGILEDQFFT